MFPDAAVPLLKIFFCLIYKSFISIANNGGKLEIMSSNKGMD